VNSGKAAARQKRNKLQLLLARKAQKSRLPLSLCLYDFSTGLWVEVNARKKIYPASLIKVLYLLTALKRLEQGHLSLDDRHVLTEQDKYAGNTRVAGTGILQFAKAGSSYTVEELLNLMISESDNVAANIILDLLGPQAITAMAAQLGLENTGGTRKMYDLESTQPANSSTARELTQMLVALENNLVCGQALKEFAVSMLLQTKNKSRIGRYLARSGIRAANKAGTVDRMVGDMALLYFPNRPPAALTVLVEIPAIRPVFVKKLNHLAAEKIIGRLARAAVKELLSSAARCPAEDQ
jgi:beta-lactamase class A